MRLSLEWHPREWAVGCCSFTSRGVIRYFWVGPVTLRVARGGQ